ncbi:MAG: hypothetical protein CMB64_01555 [Euryarchaeota archaeon]|nr:hypothetical protein [Euryarchaeota archaeon]
MSIANFSTVAANNGNRLASGTMNEGMSPSQVNDGVRSLIASIRQYYNEAEWIEYGTGNATCNYTRVSGTSLSMPVDVTSIYTVNRRVKIVDGGGATLYGRVTSVAFSSPNSTLVFEFDGGATLGSGNPTSVKHGIIGATNTSLPSVVPTGTIQMYGGASTPTGYLFCDGTAISRTTYSDLFSTISTNYGTGNGSSTFNLPNLQAKFPLGKSGSYALGSTGGAFARTPTGSISSSFTGNPFTPLGNVSVSGTVAGHQLSVSEMPSHNHLITHAGGGTTPNYIHPTYGASITHGDNNTSVQTNPFYTYPSACMSNTGGNSTHAHGFSGSGTFNGTASNPSGSVSSTLTGSSLDLTNPYQVVNYIIKY